MGLDASGWAIGSKAASPLNGTIHIVDDDDAVRDSLQILLEARGYRVESHAGGREFFASLRGEPSGCVLLDINMPVMSGIEVLAELRSRWPDLPVILITGRAENITPAQAIASGALDLLEKPFRDDALAKAIDRAFGRS